MGVDITGFQRARRLEAERAELERLEAEKADNIKEDGLTTSKTAAVAITFIQTLDTAEELDGAMVGEERKTVLAAAEKLRAEKGWPPLPGTEA